MEKSKEAFMNMREQGEEYNQAQQERAVSPSQALARTLPTLRTANQETINEMAKGYVDHYTDGNNSPAEGLALVKKVADFAEQVKNNISDFATNELKLGKGEKATIAGMIVNEQMAGVRFDYTVCGDPIWNELNSKIKAREDELKSIKGSRTEVIKSTGEVVTIYEPAKSGKMTLIFKYPK